MIAKGLSLESPRHVWRWVRNYFQVMLRTLSVLWRATPKSIAILLVTLMIQGGIPAVTVWINQSVVDGIAQGLQQQQKIGFDKFGPLVIGWTIALVFGSAFGPFTRWIWGNLKLMTKAKSFPDLTQFEDSGFYDRLQVLQKKVDQEPASMAAYVAVLAQHLFTAISLCVLLIPVAWWIPPLLVITIMPQAYVSFRMQKYSWELSEEKSPELRRMQYISSVMLTDTYAKEVRLFGLGEFLIERFWSAFQELHRAMRKLRFQQAAWTISLSVLSALGNAFAFYWVVQQAFQGKVSPGSVLLFIQALAYIQSSLSAIMLELTWLYDALLYMERFFSFLDSQPPMISASLVVPIPLRKGISFEQVQFHYPDGRLALADLSFQLFPGETLALVGENGAGKTTIVKLLARLYDPAAGKITIDGQDLQRFDLEQWRQQIAVVFQDFGQYSFSLGENIALGNLEQLGNDLQLSQAVARAGMTSLLKKVPDGYQTLLGKQFDGTELSGGEWQKIALARAFIREDQAQILILDEPTAALDPRSESEVYQRFAELARGKTTLLITHRLASTRMADRILVLKAGRLIEQGSHEQLLAQAGEYASLWKMQAEQYGY
jgi:ATP-binding cassette, subfamily B, bacterial